MSLYKNHFGPNFLISLSLGSRMMLYMWNLQSHKLQGRRPCWSDSHDKWTPYETVHRFGGAFEYGLTGISAEVELCQDELNMLWLAAKVLTCFAVMTQSRPASHYDDTRCFHSHNVSTHLASLFQLSRLLCGCMNLPTLPLWHHSEYDVIGAFLWRFSDVTIATSVTSTMYDITMIESDTTRLLDVVHEVTMLSPRRGRMTTTMTTIIWTFTLIRTISANNAARLLIMQWCEYTYPLNVATVRNVFSNLMTLKMTSIVEDHARDRKPHFFWAKARADWGFPLIHM